MTPLRHLDRTATRLSAALAVAASLMGLVTFLFGGSLRGTAVMDGSCRGTALVMVVAGVPLLVASMRRARRGSVRAGVVWFGATLYLTYNSVLVLLGTPLNRFFLLYEATVALAIASAVAVGSAVGAKRVAERASPALPARALAAYLGTVAALNTLAWLGRIVPATLDDAPGRLLEGTNLSTVPTYAQDLAFWLPFYGVIAVWLWRRRPWGYLLGGGAIAMWVIEAATIAVDQWFGHRADPSSPVASAGAIVPFAVWAMLGCWASWAFLRHLDDAPRPAAPTPRPEGFAPAAT